MWPNAPMTKDDLDAAYSLQTPDDNQRHYDDWAGSYDSDFVISHDYRLPERVAAVFADGAPVGPVLDVGAGTGLVGVALAQAGVGPVDGTDISEGMLRAAEAKGVYRRLFWGDLTDRLDVADGTYQGVVSAGTFTTGHVGPDALDEVLRIAAPGARLAISINGEHWEAAGFRTKFDALAGQITGLELRPVRYYGDAATHAHKDDEGLIAVFAKV